MNRMTFDDARPMIEGMLYTYGLYRRQAPAPPISAVYHQAAAPPPKPLPPRSPVGQYVLRHEDEIRLEGVPNQLAPFERQLVEWRYFDRARWETIARRTHMTRAALYGRLDRALYAIACLLGFLRDDPAGAADAGAG